MLIPFSEILTHCRPKGIIHIGAWDGIEMIDYANAGIHNVIFFEAQESIMPTLKARAQEYGARAFNYCLSDKREVVKFNITSNGQSSSLLKLGTHSKLYPDIIVAEVERMEAYPLTEVMRKENLNILDYDFANIDVQGAELKVLKGMGDLSHFKALYLEVNAEQVYQDCAIVDDIDEYLLEFGFTRAMTGDWRSNAWTDALYLKP